MVELRKLCGLREAVLRDLLSFIREHWKMTPHRDK